MQNTVRFESIDGHLKCIRCVPMRVSIFEIIQLAWTVHRVGIIDFHVCSVSVARLRIVVTIQFILSFARLIFFPSAGQNVRQPLNPPEMQPTFNANLISRHIPMLLIIRFPSLSDLYVVCVFYSNAMNSSHSSTSSSS